MGIAILGITIHAFKGIYVTWLGFKVPPRCYERQGLTTCFLCNASSAPPELL